MDRSSGRYIGQKMTNFGETVLPTELWAHIFGFIPVVTICQVRLVCRRWRDIVVSWPGLLDRVRVVLDRPEASSNFIMDEAFVAPPLVPVSYVTLDNWIICAVAWWPGFGQKLREISINRCTVHMSALLSMLEQSPNLQSLRLMMLCIHGIGPIPQPSFQIDGMLKLAMGNVDYEGVTVDYVLGVFVSIFPRLRDFQLRGSTRVGNLGWLVRCLQGTLERLEVIPEVSLLPELCRLKEPRLKRLAFDARDPFGEYDWGRLYRAQPHLVELIIIVDRSAVLLDTCKTLLITALTLYLVDPIPMRFLNDLARLRFLEIEGYSFDRNDPLFLGGSQTDSIRCPALNEFRTKNMRLIDAFVFFTRCPQIVTICLDGVRLENSIAVITSSCATFPVLRHLDISGCYSVGPVLLYIIANSPLLEHVRLTHMVEINDEIMRTLCQRLTRLRKLEIDQCPALSDASGEVIIENCAMLEELRLYGSRFSAELVRRLQGCRAMRVWYTQFAGL